MHVTVAARSDARPQPRCPLLREIRFTLFVAGDTPRSHFAIANLRRLADGRLAGRCITHVVDVRDDPGIVLLRYVEMPGRVRRSITVLEMRGSARDTDIREYATDDRGMHIGEPYYDVSGILAGHPVPVASVGDEG